MTRLPKRPVQRRWRDLEHQLVGASSGSGCPTCRHCLFAWVDDAAGSIASGARRGRCAHPGALGRACQPSEPPKGKAAVGNPQRLSDNEQLEILALLEAVSTERSATRRPRSSRAHGLSPWSGQRIAGELPDLNRDIKPARRLCTCRLHLLRPPHSVKADSECWRGGDQLSISVGLVRRSGSRATRGRGGPHGEVPDPHLRAGVRRGANT